MHTHMLGAGDMRVHRLAGLRVNDMELIAAHAPRPRPHRRARPTHGAGQQHPGARVCVHRQHRRQHGRSPVATLRVPDGGGSAPHTPACNAGRPPACPSPAFAAAPTTSGAGACHGAVFAQNAGNQADGCPIAPHMCASLGCPPLTRGGALGTEGASPAARGTHQLRAAPCAHARRPTPTACAGNPHTGVLSLGGMKPVLPRGTP